MQKYYRLILLIVTGFTLNLNAQITILDQTLLTQASFDSFTAVNVTGVQTWNYNPIYGAVCSGYTGQSFENEDWLISPTMNLVQTDNVKLTFQHTRGSAAVINVGVAEGWYKVYATSEFTGDPSTTVWTELDFNQTLSAAWQYVSSGDIIIPDEAKSETTRIAFRYISSAEQSATWEIKNVRVTGGPQSNNPNAGVFKITNWNTEWLGCTNFGPEDETLQINNVAAAMLAMNSDIYCIQEVSRTLTAVTIPTLVQLLGSDEWGAELVPSITEDCDQRQAIIFKKDRVQFVSSTLMAAGSVSQGNTNYYNWSNGRYPAEYNVNLIAGNTLVPVTIINIHAKAEDNNPSSYVRRLGGSEALKEFLDSPGYDTKNLIVIGDFNDFLIGTTSEVCSCTDSPFKNFMDDQDNFMGITQDLTDVMWNRPLIENTIISNELFTNYVPGSAVQELSVAQNIDNYFYTTSNHLPVSAIFQFPVLGNSEPDYVAGSSWKIYPNPVKDLLVFDEAGEDDTVSIFDLTGRRMNFERVNSGSVDVEGLPVGIYILKVGEKYGRFVKE